MIRASMERWAKLSKPCTRMANIDLGYLKSSCIAEAFDMDKNLPGAFF
jgi:hypothetical protein